MTLHRSSKDYGRQKQLQSAHNTPTGTHENYCTSPLLLCCGAALKAVLAGNTRNAFLFYEGDTLKALTSFLSSRPMGKPIKKTVHLALPKLESMWSQVLPCREALVYLNTSAGVLN